MCECGESDLIKGACYDCAVLCLICGEEPALPTLKICAGCSLKAKIEDVAANELWILREAIKTAEKREQAQVGYCECDDPAGSRLHICPDCGKYYSPKDC